MALLSDYFEDGQLQPDGPEHPHSVLAVPYILAIPIHPGHPAHFQLFLARRCACGSNSSIFQHGTIDLRTVWDYRFAYGMGPSAIARMAFFK